MSEPDWEFVDGEGRAGWHPSIAALWGYLRSRRPSGPPFRRADFDPVDVPRLLPRLWLFDVLRDPLDFRYRVVGTNITASMNVDPTGRKLSEFYADKRDVIAPVWARMETTVATRRASWRRGPAIATRHDTRDAIENVMLPFVDAAGEAEMLFGLSVIFRVDGTEY